MLLRLLCTKSSRVSSKVSSFISHGLCISDHSLRPMSEMSYSSYPHSFTVSYLQNSCGLSQESAISASRKLFIRNPEKADSFLHLMRAHGLSETHLKKIIQVHPALLLADLEAKIRPNVELFESLGISGSSLGKMLCKQPFVLVTRKASEVVEFFRARGFSDEQIRRATTKLPVLYRLSANTILKPKLEFLESLGLSDKDIAKFLSSSPYILSMSLENKLIPYSQVLQRVLGAQILKVLKVWSVVSRSNLKKNLEPNVSLLRKHGVPESLILMVSKMQPSVLFIKQDRLTDILGKVEKLGLDPRTRNFILAFRSMAVIGEPVWEQKLEAFKSFGFSVEQIYAAFKVQPFFMLSSLKKIKNSTDFLFNKLNMKPADVCRSPYLLMHSLEKRIIPRCSVLQVLMELNVLDQKTCITTYIRMPEKNFMGKTVAKYREVIPDLVEVYQGKIVVQEFPAVLRLRN